MRDAYDQAGDSRELCAQAEQKVFAIMDGRSTQSVQSISDVLHEAMDRMEARMRGEHTDGTVETGLTDFDTLTGGLHNGELVILAARPSMGKTALAMNIGEHASIELRVPTLVRQPGNVGHRVGRPHALLAGPRQRSPAAKRYHQLR